jgi:hypothetical protein
MFFEVHMVMMLVCNEGGANELTEKVLKAFNVWAVAKVLTKIFVDLRQITNVEIEAGQEVKIIFDVKVKIICWGKKTMQSPKRPSQRIEKAQHWSRT